METNLQKTMPALALRGLTVFHNMLLHFDVGRAASIKALDESMGSGQPIFLVAQRDLAVEDPQEKDLYSVGTVCNVRQLLRLPGDNVRVMVEGLSRGRLLEMTQTEPYLAARVEELPAEQPVRRSARTEALIRQTYELFESFIELAPKMTPDILLSVLSSEDPGYIADYIAQNLPMRTSDKQAILEELRPVRRLERLCQSLRREVEILEMEQELQGKVREQLTRSQRDYVLREQMKVIQQELGEDGAGGDNELAEYRQRIAGAKLPREVAEKLNKEVGRLEKQPFGSAEASVIRGYLDTVLELPWGKKTKERVDVAAARKVLDADHFGLDKVKERILEFLAVKQLAPQLRGQILCLVGPPGVGKTSIARSIAEATGRKYVRVSLGGVSDEAEIMGHRRTYVGSMPGRIINAVKQAGVNNPLILLDEIDKLGQNFKGDPSSALLEVLDPEQNTEFTDHYVDMPFDLSNVLFITTANDAGRIPGPLYDRMDIIELGSYTLEEKLNIATRHLIKKQLKKHGIQASQLKFTKAAVKDLIESYTREAGVRTLERSIASICRKVAKMIVSDGEFTSYTVKPENLEELLGPRKYTRDQLSGEDTIGLVNGLAWTSVGGELLPIEVAVMEGTGKIQLTGSLGDVMKESAGAAITCIRTRAGALGISPKFYEKCDIHIHAPEGAVPKDGPSAGIAMATAITSALCGIPVRHDVAMTGEITLQGRVLPIGGLKEKSMAAYKNGIKTVLIPAENVPDLAEVDSVVKENVKFIPVKRVDTVLETALTHMPRPVTQETVVLAGDITAKHQKAPELYQ